MTEQSNDLHILIFIASVAEEFVNEDFPNLHTLGTAFNMEHNITGLIVYGNGNTFHILEGSKADLQAKLKLIRQDTRLHNLITLVNKTLQSRYLEGKPFLFKPLYSNKLKHFDDFAKPENEGFMEALLKLDDLNIKLLKEFIRNNV